jgi:RNA polymerase sigma-70 factor, ECF subfamily
MLPKERLFEEIVAANQRRIVGIARSYARGEECRDLTQEILLQLWKGLDGFQGRSAPSTWVYRVALNTAISYRRKNGMHMAPGREEFPADPAVPPGAGKEVLILESFLHSLGKIDRALFLLYLEDLSYREMSEISGLTETNVGVRICRLKKMFEESYCGG